MKDQPIDSTPRLLPDTMGFLTDGGWKVLPIEKVEIFPPGERKGCPILETLTAVLVQSRGSVRWFGFQSARINSELRVVVEGFSPLDEVRSKWEVCLNI